MTIEQLKRNRFNGNESIDIVKQIIFEPSAIFFGTICHHIVYLKVKLPVRPHKLPETEMMKLRPNTLRLPGLYVPGNTFI